MRVLFLSSWYPSGKNPLKGVFIKKHAAVIKAAGVDIQVLALSINPSKKIFEKRTHTFIDENSVRTCSVEVNSRFYKVLYLNLFFQKRLLKRVMRSEIKPVFKPDLIHSNVLFPSGILGYWLAQREKLPHIITEHWSKVDKFMKKSIYASQGKKAYKCAANVTVVSEFLKNSLSKHISDRKKIVVIPNVVNTDMFAFKEKPQKKDDIVFTCVAHWTSPKRPDLIFNSLQNFSKIIKKKIVLNVVGEGHLLNELKGGSWNFEINYLGNKKPELLAELLQSTDYFLHASNIETFSIVIAEALATGTPVLASNVGAIPELISFENGIVSNNTIEEWTDGLKKITDKSDYNSKLISEKTAKFGPMEVGNMFKKVYSDQRMSET